MSDKFPIFAKAVRDRFADMARNPLYVTATDREFIWAAYLAYFPPGTDPIYRKRSEHDCACCRSFIRNVGNVIAIENGAVSTVWDLNGLPEPYQTVANGMASYIRLHSIRHIFLAKDASQGTPLSRQLNDDKSVTTWSHFAVTLPPTLVDKRRCDARIGEANTKYRVLVRGLTELTPEAVSTVLDLINDNALYRGAEFKAAVLEFYNMQGHYRLAATDAERDLLAWKFLDSPAALFRNTVIGTLVQDLSEGVDLERAVRSFEAKVAPTNYKRPTALITKRMVDDAMKEIAELGLEPALERRLAKLSDVSVNSVLFVDNAVREKMKDGSLKGLLMEEVRPPVLVPTKAEDISVEAFMSDVLPKTKGIEVFLDNAHLNNFVSLTAPVHLDAAPLFRWDNGFAWSYDGNVTDTIKERVKRAGGKVEGVSLRVSLAWYNYDDLDLHCVPPNGGEIYFGNKANILDVDMNAGGGHTREPVENMRWVGLPRDGEYRFFVHQYSRRENTDLGFEIEIETIDHGVQNLRYIYAVRGNVDACWIKIRNGKISIEPGEDMVGGARPQEKWGLMTLSRVRVNSIVLSPNHWDDNEVGNKHWFFILEGCKNPAPARGIYNEFLSPKLEKHRKVFEVLGEKTKCPVADEQLSGLGFSSTRKDKVTVIATGPKLNKAYTINF